MMRAKGNRKTYRITESGKDVLRKALEKENQLRTNIRALFEEYMKSVLEVDSRLDLLLKMSLSLVELLLEPDENKEDTIRRFEEQRSMIRETIKQLQKNIKIINLRIQSLIN
jgi:DNA-binding PadR family transcriptional regulator